jgi:hypothetical protein
MPPIVGSPGTNQSPNAPSPSGPPPCPVCAGLLVPLRDQYRCSRCFFSFCVGCENPDEYSAGDTGD